MDGFPVIIYRRYVQAIGKTGKDVIDYITDQIDKVVNDKEEDKK